VDRNGKLEREIAGLGNLPREKLVERWQKTFGCLPPKGIKRGLLERTAAWHLQARRYGGLNAESRKMLRRLNANRCLVDVDTKSLAVGIGTATSQPNDNPGNQLRRNAPTTKKQSTHSATAVDVMAANTRASLQPGARLVREWNGRTYIVEVTDDGFLHDDKHYRSLSAIARAITGAHWSGPRFFGL
jgi:hypothetical protein